MTSPSPRMSRGQAGGEDGGGESAKTAAGAMCAGCLQGRPASTRRGRSCGRRLARLSAPSRCEMQDGGVVGEAERQQGLLGRWWRGNARLLRAAARPHPSACALALRTRSPTWSLEVRMSVRSPLPARSALPSQGSGSIRRPRLHCPRRQAPNDTPRGAIRMISETISADQDGWTATAVLKPQPIEPGRPDALLVEVSINAASEREKAPYVCTLQAGDDTALDGLDARISSNLKDQRPEGSAAWRALSGKLRQRLFDTPWGPPTEGSHPQLTPRRPGQ